LGDRPLSLKLPIHRNVYAGIEGQESIGIAGESRVIENQLRR